MTNEIISLVRSSSIISVVPNCLTNILKDMNSLNSFYVAGWLTKHKQSEWMFSVTCVELISTGTLLGLSMTGTS